MLPPIFCSFICPLKARRPPPPQRRLSAAPSAVSRALSLLSIIIAALIPESYRSKLKCVVLSVYADVLRLHLDVAHFCLAPLGAEINWGGLALA